MPVQNISCLGMCELIETKAKSLCEPVNLKVWLLSKYPWLELHVEENAGKESEKG